MTDSPKGALLIAGTSSGAGKSTVVAGLCRLLARRGVSVAPFKAQNMSLNSFVTTRGEEIGRAQALQAQAARIQPEATMNPVLLKPGSENRTQVIVLGRPVGEMEAQAYWSSKHSLLDVVVDAHRDLRSRFDVVVCEGAGSPAEINLRSSDIVNLGFARAVGALTIVVGDIDRGGVFASFVGTVSLLCPEDQRLVRGFVVNRFRGDRRLLEPGLKELERLTGRPTYGVVPYVHGLGLDAEDSLDPAAYLDLSPPVGPEVLRVGVIRLPHASNLTDLDPLAAEPGVVVRFMSSASELCDADLVVLPGTRATVSDLGWLRSRAIDRGLGERAAAGRPILGLCGGYEMLGRTIEDDVESRRGTVKGLGLLPVRTIFVPNKVLGRPRRTLNDGSVVEGYEVHHGKVEVCDDTGSYKDGGSDRRIDGGKETGNDRSKDKGNDGERACEPLFADEGLRCGAVAGTMWHGLFENDTFRRSYLEEIAGRAGRAYKASSDTCFADIREALIEKLADVMEDHLDTASLLGLLDPGSSVARETPPDLTLSRDGQRLQATASG